MRFEKYGDEFSKDKHGIFSVPSNGTSDEGAIWPALAFAPAENLPAAVRWVEVEAEKARAASGAPPPPPPPPAKPVLGTFSMASILQVLMPSETSSDLPDSVVLPGGADGASEGGFFHVDSTGRTCFSAAEAAKSARFCVDSGFLEQLQSRIAETRFDLPQSKAEGSAFFCNEKVYGKMNVLRLTGVMRLADEGGAPEGAAERGAAAKAAFAAAMAAADSEGGCDSDCDIGDGGEEDWYY